ncbi:hypothetical protein BD626DRAFT_550386 [Schizophyllum amplum]|uniref:RRM domain-containing protein n=1 Tax=Schizophyllum amplum TaxID=97359 RepID=A0A550C3B4_9AGAR|nr:hypothetical protein BD626DRAFT_550386 [Auriculariopsis ampla]
MSSSATMGRRLYLGKLPPDTSPEDVKKTFTAYGPVVDCRVMTGFGFIEYETTKDAEDAVTEMNGKDFMGNTIAVEFARENRPRREPYERESRDYGAPRRRPGGHRVLVTGVSRDTSWQDLKDFGREAGSVTFADIDRDVPGQGVLEYMSRDDAEHAVRSLDRRDLRGHAVNVAIDETRGGGGGGGADNYRRDSRYDRDDRRDYDRRDRDRGDRDHDRGYRGGRSRSPRRDRYDDRRARSPPPSRDYDDRKPSGYDGYSRYDHDYGYERRRTDDRDRRRDDKVEDRPSRSSGGDRDGRW